MKFRILPLLLLAVLATSCKVEFSPNAPWKDIPSVYCVIDIQEDTVWARVQRCYLGNDNLYNYATIADSTNYQEGDIQVHLLAWRGVTNPLNHSITATDQLVDRWQLTYTEVPGRPEGNFSSGSQPMYYCVPGADRLLADSACVFQLLVIRTDSGDTLASARTTLVGILPLTIMGREYVENVITVPNNVRGRHFGFIPVNIQNEIRWTTLPRGRRYQPSVRFYYRKNDDTLSIEVPGAPLTNQYGYNTLSSNSISQTSFLSYIKRSLAGNTDSLFNVNYVDIIIYVCNEDLNAYITSQNSHVVGGQEYQPYTNVEGGIGIFGSRRTHIQVSVPCDSNGRPDYLPDQLKRLGVGFYGNFAQ
jgi:hypothetical protein